MTNLLNTVNKEFLDEIKSPTQLDEHEVNTNVTDIDFIVNCSTKNTDRAISNTDNISKENLSESYLEKRHTRAQNTYSRYQRFSK